MSKRISSQLSPEELETYLQIPDEASFISHPDFQDPLIKEELFGPDAEKIEIPVWQGFYSLPRVNSSRKPSPQSRVLSRREEKTLFLRFNYARYRLSLLLKAQAKAVSGKRAKKMVLWFRRAEKTRLDIIKANLPLAVYRAQKFFPSRLTLSERISECNLALIKCIERFDVSRGNKFSTYFSVTAYWNLVGSEKEASEIIQVDPVILETISRDDPKERASDSAWVLREIIGGKSCGLSKTERVILSRYYGFSSQEETLKNISGKVNLSIERVRQIKEEALRKVEIFLSANPEILNLK